MSYADLVTLLFAFFTVLYAASQVQQPATTAPAGTPVETLTPPVSPEATDDAQARAAVEALRVRMSQALDDDVRGLRAEISRDGRGLVVSLPEEATFLPGRAEVTKEARPLVTRIVRARSVSLSQRSDGGLVGRTGGISTFSIPGFERFRSGRFVSAIALLPMLLLPGIGGDPRVAAENRRETKENPLANHRQTAKNTELVVPNSIQLHPD